MAVPPEVVTATLVAEEAQVVHERPDSIRYVARREITVEDIYCGPISCAVAVLLVFLFWPGNQAIFFFEMPICDLTSTHLSPVLIVP